MKELIKELGMFKELFRKTLAHKGVLITERSCIYALLVKGTMDILRAKSSMKNVSTPGTTACKYWDDGDGQCHKEESAQEAQGVTMRRLREVMKTEHNHTWDRSNESLLVIMQEGGKPRMASYFEECLLNTLDRICPVLSEEKVTAPVKEESLAELADRKGAKMCFGIDHQRNSARVFSEQECRQYLLGLANADKGEENANTSNRR